MTKRQIRERRREKQKMRDKIVNMDFAELEARTVAYLHAQGQEIVAREREDNTFATMYGVQRCPQE